MQAYKNIKELMESQNINPTQPILFVKKRGTETVECISDFFSDAVILNGEKTSMEELYEGYSDLGGKPLGK